MRLTDKEIEVIKKTIDNYIKADIYIFGSRLRDDVKGGDVDIFISPNKSLSLEDEFELKLTLKEELEEKLFMPVDIVFDRKKDRKIEKEAKKGYKL